MRFRSPGLPGRLCRRRRHRPFPDRRARSGRRCSECPG
jgi:hypothetical protein